MAHHAEPMDIDSDFDNKENSLHHNNVLPFTEKGYEELDVSELNMKLRYSITPASSPMSKSYTAHCVDNRSLELGDDTLNITINDNSNLTRSLNSNVAKNDTVVKSLKSLPLQAISSEQFGDNNRSTSVLRPLDTTVTQDNADVTFTVSGTSYIDENSQLSSSSSVVPTPEATTPTKDNLKNDGGSSPIMRGIKTVLNMFRSSQSPIPPADSESIVKPDILSPEEAAQSTDKAKSQDLLASTPISNHRKKEISPTKRNSPHKESIVFNEDLEKELQWKDETTIIFSHERIPIHKLFQLPQTEIKNANQDEALPTQEIQDDMNSTVEYMDISYNDSFRDRTITDGHDKIDYTLTGDSDAEFLDCETTFTKNDSLQEDNDKTPVNEKTLEFDLTKELQSTNENTSASRLKQIILNTTQDILDATLSITPEDLLSESLHKDQSKLGEDNSILGQIPASNSTIILPNEIAFNANETSKVSDETLKNSITLHENPSALNQTVEIANLSADDNQLSNVTATSENVISPILDKTIEITNSEMNTEYEEELDATELINKILSETVTIDSQHNIQENPDLTLSSEMLILNEKNIEDLRRSSTNHHDHDLLQQEITQDIEPSKKTSLDTTNASEHNSTNLVKSTNTSTYNPETLQEILNNSLLNPDDEGKSSPIREASITELASEVPLPDEDDLDKELNMPADQTDASTLPSSLPLDLVNNIKDQNEVTEIAHNLTLENEKGIIHVEGNSEDKTVIPEPNFERSDNIQDEMVVLVQERIKEMPEAIIEPPLTEEAQVAIVDVLPETAQSSNMETTTVNTIDQMLNYVEVLNQTEADIECINTTVTHNSEETIRLSQTMDINESIVGLKPLPDIINQTNVVPNVENVKSAEYVPEPIMVEQQENMPEDFNKKTLKGNTVVSPETVPEAAHNVVPELLSDKHANELTKIINNELAPAHDEITKDSATDGSAPIVNEDIPVVTDTVKDTQLNYVGIIPTEHVIQDNEKQTINTNVPISQTADIKTVDDFIVSENTSPFVSVTAEDIPGVQSEENIDVQNIEQRLVTDGKIVFTPPASPPIASKGYNFNFDEMDDPFATKTKIRISPPLDTSTKVVETKMSSKSAEKPVMKKEMINRRKSQTERKKPVASKRKFNSSYSGAVTDKAVESPIEKSTVGEINVEPPPSVALELNNVTVEEKLIEEIHKSEEELKPKDEVEQPVITSSAEVIEIETDESVIHLKDSKSTSSSEQSAYHTAGTSSNDSFHSRNVFNIPEIDDQNFNPFATKSKMRQSPPPPNLDTANPFATISKIRSSPDSSMIVPQNDEANAQDVTKSALLDDKLETELMEKDGLENLSNTTTSSKPTDDKNGTIKEVNTDDEDTVEGPFLEADDKMIGFDGENIDMMQFHDLPTQVNDENGDNGELFIDAEAFEFLLNHKNTVVDSGKESLFLKFDPLFAKRMSAITSEGLGASLNEFQKRQSTPTKVAKPDEKVNSPVAGPSNLNTTQDMDITHNSREEFNEDLNITVSKPTMAVPPAVNPVTPRNKSLTPNRSNRRSLTFTSPAMAVIDRLLSLSGNTSLLHETAVAHATREQDETDLALTELRELLAEKEITVYSLRSESKELKDRLSSLESHLKSLEDESQDRLKKINDLNDRLAEKTKINKSMAAVVEEYERTIASLISETAQDKKRHAEERIKLIKERDEQMAHLASMEVSFSDLHSKYEKSKQVILSCKANEDAYKKSIKEFEENITKMQNNYELLKQHATSKLNHANQELEKMNKTHDAEVLKLNAMIKRKDLHITSLEESLSQKTKANEELTAICDELINKVG